MATSIPRKKSALSPAAALRTGSASPGVYAQPPATARGQLPTNRPPSPPLRSARAYKPAAPAPAPIDLSWLPPPPPPPPEPIADSHAADLASPPPMTARGRNRDVSFVVDVSPARTSPAVAAPSVVTVDAETRGAEMAAAQALKAKEAALVEQHAAEAAAARARAAKRKAEAELRAAELRAMEEATERARQARLDADAERSDAERAAQVARQARAAAEAEERSRAIQEATERARRHLAAQRDASSSSALVETARASSAGRVTSPVQIELSAWVANPLVRVADVPVSAAPVVLASQSASSTANAMAPITLSPPASPASAAPVVAPAAFVPAPASANVVLPSPMPAADTSKECGPVFVCVPCLHKPITLGYIILGVALGLIFILIIASASVAAQRATSGGTSASSYFGTQIDKPEWSYQDVILPLSWDLVGNAAKMMDVFNTSTPDPFLPLLCSTVTAVCNYTNWQGGASEFDLLGPANDNYVPLSLTGGAIDRSNFVRLELSFTNFQPSTTGGTVGVNWRLALPPHMVNANRAPATSLFTIQCQIGRFLIAAAQGSGDTSGTLTLPLDSGTISFYPLDVYTKTVALFCTVSDPGSQFQAYSKADPDARKLLSVIQQPLSFILKIDKSDTGLFAHADIFTAAPVASPTLVNGQAKLGVTWQRPAISCVFPGFIMAAFWIIAIFDVLYLTPFLGTGVKLNGPPTVGVCASLLFALPGIRNAMPGNAPVGSVFDFASYYWAVLIATMCFAYAVSRWCVDVHPPPPAPSTADKKAE